jgi:predicted flap endonuclease-1-like 5' DNA nuclease
VTKLSTIEGIGPAFEEKLKQAGVTSCEELLEKGASKEGRDAIEKASGIDHSRISRFVNHADLCRIKGVGGEYAELLEASGVDSVPELAQRKAENLAAKMAEVNEAKKLVRALPSAKAVAEWIAQAKSLPRVVTH